MSEQSPIVIKIGGKFFDEMAIDETSVEGFFRHIDILIEQNRDIVLVHGGGSQVTNLMEMLGRETKKIDGLRVTEDDDIDIVAGVLAGQLNKRLVAKLSSREVCAAGVSLADGHLANCIKVSESLGWVGDPIDGNPALINALFANGIVPVIATIGSDASGNLYNVNADHAAMHIARILNAELVLLSDVSGVLNANKELIRILRADEIDVLINESVITDGMVVKVNAAKAVADELQQSVTIASWSDNSGGTRILPEKTMELSA